MSDGAKLAFVIPGAKVSVEEARIMTALVGGGYDVADLDLIPLAEAAVVRDTINGVKALGILISAAPWGRDGNGGLEIEFDISTDADLVTAKMHLAGL